MHLQDIEQVSYGKDEYDVMCEVLAPATCLEFKTYVFRCGITRLHWHPVLKWGTHTTGK